MASHDGGCDRLGHVHAMVWQNVGDQHAWFYARGVPDGPVVMRISSRTRSVRARARERALSDAVRSEMDGQGTREVSARAARRSQRRRRTTAAPTQEEARGRCYYVSISYRMWGRRG